MSVAAIAVSVIYAIAAVILVLAVLLQSGKSAGLSGAISGAAETFLTKNKAKSADARLAKATKWVAIMFMVLTLVLSFLL